MPANLDDPSRWKEDIARSVDFYNEWFLKSAPVAFREARATTSVTVETGLEATADLRDLSPEALQLRPGIVATLRMCTAPPLAIERLIGLAGVPPAMIRRMEKRAELPPRMPADELERNLAAVSDVLRRLLDRDLFTWLDRESAPDDRERERAIAVVADRLTGSIVNPLLRLGQEQRQLDALRAWLVARGYRDAAGEDAFAFDAMEAGTFRFRANVPPAAQANDRDINVPMDAVVMPHGAERRDYPVLIEAKSAGDFTNVNKRRKEEAAKFGQLRLAYGRRIALVLFLGGYFDSGYLGYEAAEGIDWVWEHRPGDLAEVGL